MCNYLHLQASFGSSVQITVTFCFELKFLRVQPCWSWSTLCQWRTGQKVLTLYTFCQWRAESPGTPYTFASEGQKVLALLPVKGRKSWHTLYFCQWRSESPGTFYTFASEGQKVLAHFILLPVKVRKSWHTLYFCQSQHTLYFCHTFWLC